MVKLNLVSVNMSPKFNKQKSEIKGKNVDRTKIRRGSAC